MTADPSTLGAAGFALLLASTAGVAVVHTLAGPDHYLPFIVMGRARRWSTWRTVAWTSLCGAGHVASSVVIAAGAVVLGHGLEQVELIEEFRGNLAAWLMIAFGAVYLAWGLTRAFRGRRHVHPHTHEDGEVHAHAHTHGGAHLHLHAETAGFRLTPWVLFTLFVLGPCEPMIPLVMYPAAQGEWLRLAAVVAVFGLLTVGAMLATVLLAARGLRLLPLERCERFAHAGAGAAVLGAGCAIQFLGL
jgi:sulfite exporter TauE/SafE